MRPITCLVVLALSLGGCVPPDEEEGTRFDPGPDLTSEEGLPAVMEAPLLVEAPDEGPVDPGDDDDDDDRVDPWDAGEPDVPDGTLATFRLTCGLLTGPSLKVYEKDGAIWNELRLEETETTPRPELVSCFTEGPKTMLWESDGAIWIEAGGLGHDLLPVVTYEGRWLGGVQPIERASGACQQALAELGLSWPVNLSLELLDLDLP